jgi:ssDNA-binding Zn-finger/Zn-ribbon topoisomerase 1
MTESKDHVDVYKSIRMLGKKAADSEASFARGATLETLDIITAISRLVSTDAAKKRSNLFAKLAEEAARIHDDSNPFAIGNVLDEMGDKYPTDLARFYREYLTGEHPLSRGNHWKEFEELILNPTEKYYGNILKAIPEQYNTAYIGEQLLHRDPIAFANYVNASSEREEKVSWEKWPGKDRWLHSWDTSASYVHCIGDPGSGKTTLQLYNMERNASLGGWSVTNIPVEDDEKRHIYHCTRASDMIPIMYRFMDWVQEARKYFPAANPVLYIGIDEKPKEKTSKTENDNRNSFLTVRRHYGAVVFATGAVQDDPQVENMATELIRISHDQSGVTMKVKRENEPDDEVRVPHLSPSIRLKYSSQDEAPHWTWDINFDSLKDLIGMDYDIRDLSWKEMYERALEAIPVLLGDFNASEEKEKLPAISICPACGYEMPFRSRSPTTVRCQNPHCHIIYSVDPSSDPPHNFRIVDEQYEKEAHTSAQKNQIKKDLGIAICPYCGNTEPYRRTQEDLVKCTKCGEIYHINPQERENYSPYDSETIKKIRQQKEEQKKKESMHPLDELILSDYAQIREMGTKQYCKKHRSYRGVRLVDSTMRMHIAKLKKQGLLDDDR